MLQRYYSFTIQSTSYLIKLMNNYVLSIVTPNHDFLLLRGVQLGSCLIEATFSVEESTMTRGDVIWYKYAVQQEQQIEEMAIRYVQIPPDNNVKGTKIC